MTKKQLFKKAHLRGFNLTINPDKSFLLQNGFSIDVMSGPNTYKEIDMYLETYPIVVGISENAFQAVKCIKEIKWILDIYTSHLKSFKRFKKQFGSTHHYSIYQQNRYLKARSFGCNHIEAIAYA